MPSRRVSLPAGMAQDAFPDFSLEAAAGGVVAGVDEAGRGPLAGPVVAAAVILAPDDIPRGITDSKKLPAARRETLFAEIAASARLGIGAASVAEIDEINILQATMLAMGRALCKLPESPTMVLVDGNRAPKINCPVKTVVGGDAKCLSIAAASIVAKVTRDRLMKALAAQYPGYGWERNAGYGTAEHRDALARLGVTPHHRSSFAPMRNLMTQDLLSNL